MRSSCSHCIPSGARFSHTVHLIDLANTQKHPKTTNAQGALFEEGAPLQLLASALKMLGAMCVPSLLLVLGANLQRGVRTASD